jgi:hypothetical protein
MEDPMLFINQSVRPDNTNTDYEFFSRLIAFALIAIFSMLAWATLL